MLIRFSALIALIVAISPAHSTPLEVGVKGVVRPAACSITSTPSAIDLGAADMNAVPLPRKGLIPWGAGGKVKISISVRCPAPVVSYIRILAEGAESTVTGHFALVDELNVAAGAFRLDSDMFGISTSVTNIESQAANGIWSTLASELAILQPGVYMSRPAISVPSGVLVNQSLKNVTYDLMLTGYRLSSYTHATSRKLSGSMRVELYTL